MNLLRRIAVVVIACCAIGCRQNNNVDEPLAPHQRESEPSGSTTRVTGLEEGWELVPEATYTATQAGGQVILAAVGEHPAANYEAKLVQSMLKIWPPQYLLARRQTGDMGAAAITPFEATASFNAADPVSQLIVHDAAGRHEVKVESVSE
jgi:hypothetical protein